MQSGRLAAVAVAACVAALWALGMAGLEGTIVPQRIDFEQFHQPTILRFATLPFAEAVRDYGAAPFPLFYIVFGAIFAATGSLTALWIASAGLCAGVALAALALCRTADGQRTDAARLALAGFLLASPYLRGQTIWANTDVLPLLCLLAALHFDRAAERGGSFAAQSAALLCAFLAFYTRQFYLFAPAALAVRYILLDGRNRAACLALCAVLSLPGIALIATWHGVVPPSFAQHEQRPYPLAALPYVFANVLLYLSPVLAIALRESRALIAATFARPAVMSVAAAAWLGYLGYFLLSPAEYFAIGGGLLAQAFQRLPLAGASSFHLLVVVTSLCVPLLAYLVAQDWRRNLVLLLFVACFMPTGIIFQRYFDPALVVLLFLAMRVREVDLLLRGAGRFAYPLLELGIAAIGFVHYGRLFGIF